MTKARPVENDVKAEVRKLLDAFGWHHWPGSAGPYSMGGVSDRLAVRGRPGHGCIFLAIEVKLDKPSGSKLQETFLSNCRAQGAIGVVVNMERLPKLRALLEAIDRGLFPKPLEHREGDFGWTTDGATTSPSIEMAAPVLRSSEALTAPAKPRRRRV